MKDLLSNITGLAGLTAVSVGAGMAELWLGIVVGGASLVFISHQLGASK